ncbi:dihydroorotate dehydrogenase [Pseudalkalibacillus sp. Hm43]|uniref:dihydroorotate dehydrogenase n=1 Tax=Pseudalkalibacillus sp. Hm43 TaxID=3450742 RepID=UPI003F43E655
MPDWSYHTFFKPLLFNLKPAKARSITLNMMNTLISIPYGYRIIEFFGHMASSPAIRKNVCGVEVESPVGLSGQVDPKLQGISALSNLGFGYIEVGPITIDPVHEPEIKLHQEYNTIEYSHLQENTGFTHVEEVLSNRKLKIPVLFRIGEASLQDTLKIIHKLKKYADWFVLDTSFHAETLAEIKEAAGKPILVNVEKQHEIDHSIEWIDGFYIPEGKKVEQSNHVGPLELDHHLERIHQLQSYEKSIIVSGGIHEPADAITLMGAGADLVQIHSGFIFSGPGLPKRINEALTYEVKQKQPTQPGWLASFLMGLGVFIAGIIATFVGLTDVILSPDERFLGMTKQEIQHFSDHLFKFMSHDRISLAGVMISAGFLYMMLAYHGIRNGSHWARKVFYIAATLGFLNFFYFIGFGYLDPIHLLYNGLILPFFLYGFIKTRNMPLGSEGSNTRNTTAWRKSQFGQTMFIILGGAFLTAGIVISYIGMTDVFVKEDLGFLELDPEHIHDHNQQFISLIAHDRAGFGGALISAGIMIALIAMWGYREGEEWIWWTLTLGGIPGFAAGIGIHYHIGYVDQYHLAPAYFAVLLYVLGVVYSYPYLMKR